MRNQSFYSFVDENAGHEFQTAFIKVARGIEKNTPKNQTCFQRQILQELSQEDEVLLLQKNYWH
ncbi:MAG: hypothetical protein CM15mP126_2340 [Gammaproteobacteria bacterium]|nr:MAG: hypothetical protein CM15mP126_2340 [Gammaproteobacteria bacterium]